MPAVEWAISGVLPCLFSFCFPCLLRLLPALLLLFFALRRQIFRLRLRGGRGRSWDEITRKMFNPVSPQAKTPQKGVGVVACPATRGQIFQLLGVASAQHDVVGLEGGR